MPRRVHLPLPALAAALFVSGCGNQPSSQASAAADAGTLTGAWRSKMAFRSGPPSDRQICNRVTES